MTRQAFDARVKLLAFGLGGLTLLALQACSTAPTPKYPIYMQNRPAEATETAAQAGDDQMGAAMSSASSASSMTAPVVAPQGKVSVNDLPPPPPPPPEDETDQAPAAPPRASAPHKTEATAPVKDMRAGYVYVLTAHDTLYGVSRRFGVPVKELYALNGLAPDASLRIGEKVLLPPTAKDDGVDPHANGDGMVKLAAALAAKPVVQPKAESKPEVKPQPVAAKPAPVVSKPVVSAPEKPSVSPPSSAAAAASKPVQTAPAPQPAAPSGFPSNARLAEMGQGLFVWPVRGRILAPFGQLAPNVRNDGVNIAASAGTDVKAASDGVVVYEGDQVKELGNTIYIKHDNGWYTGYSHLQTMSVKNNERVTKGEVIGTVGQTGVIDKPQLHFEIRYTPSTDIARPIDPTLVLPR
jgi:murein DD-endopeptidase MepM/ murein hydrolase activator NlpD